MERTVPRHSNLERVLLVSQLQGDQADLAVRCPDLRLGLQMVGGAFVHLPDLEMHEVAILAPSSGRRGYGWADVEQAVQATPRTPFAERDVVALDRPINDPLPGEGIRTWPGDTRPQSAAFTIWPCLRSFIRARDQRSSALHGRSTRRESLGYSAEFEWTLTRREGGQ